MFKMIMGIMNRLAFKTLILRRNKKQLCKVIAYFMNTLSLKTKYKVFTSLK